MKQNVKVKSHTRTLKTGKEVVVREYSQQRKLSEKEIKEIQDYIVQEAPKHGYDVLETAWSDTSDKGWGISAYVYLWRPEEKFSIKIRISDHTIGNMRMADEQSIFNLEDAKSFLQGKWKKVRQNTNRFEYKIIKPSQLIDGDQVRKEFVTPKGEARVDVKRPIFQTFYELVR